METAKPMQAALVSTDFIETSFSDGTCGRADCFGKPPITPSAIIPADPEKVTCKNGRRSPASVGIKWSAMSMVQTIRLMSYILRLLLVTGIVLPVLFPQAIAPRNDGAD